MRTVSTWRVSSGNSGHCGMPAVIPFYGAENRSNWHVMDWRGMDISDSFRERPMLRPLPQIAMRRRRLPVTLPKHAGSRDRHAELAGCANIRSRSGRTSMLGLQKADQKKHQKGYSGKYPYLWPAHHGRARADRSKDATDIKAHEPPSRGCDLPLNFHRAAIRASAVLNTPSGAV
ncbi:hypothetical protein IE4803_PB00175 (plasmid) [Rhizobium etli bv. phaseoli str. IE4803]|nr:hypothetical protein IE4803_PB00175 [Rhizobium etli bv. phaseoli str. IE4803]